MGNAVTKALRMLSRADGGPATSMGGAPDFIHEQLFSGEPQIPQTNRDVEGLTEDIGNAALKAGKMAAYLHPATRGAMGVYDLAHGAATGNPAEMFTAIAGAPSKMARAIGAGAFAEDTRASDRPEMGGGGDALRKAMRMLGKLYPEGAAGYTPPRGMSGVIDLKDLGRVQSRPIEPIMDVAESYRKSRGLTGSKMLDSLVPINKEFSQRVAGAYGDLRHDPSDPAVKHAYDALIEETMDQLRAAKPLGINYEFVKPTASLYEPTPALGYHDILTNRRMGVFPTAGGFGTLNEAGADNPLLRPVGRIGNLRDATANDAFRIVHDLYGHYGPGNAFFRGPGEERAYQLHSKMYSPEALPAAAAETRGQNSFVNYGPYAEHNKTASGSNTIYADQKTGMMPEWSLAAPPEEGADVDAYIQSLKGMASGGGAWTRKEGKNPKGGLNEKGRASLRAQGHDIKRPQPEGGSRRDSFCARMKGMKAKLTSKETASDPDSRINKSLRAWNCRAGGGTVEAALRLAKNKPTLNLERAPSHLNFQYAKLGPYRTELGIEEPVFRQWVEKNQVPFDPNEARPDYDMRGYYRAMMQGDQGAQTAIDPYDHRPHYPDTYKTPSHESFSADSKYATPDAPKWNEDDQLVDKSGAVVIDSRLPHAKGGQVWDKPRPKHLGKPHHLSSSQKSKAKAAAKAAGRPYPNLVDNMRAARADGGRANLGAGGDAVKRAMNIIRAYHGSPHKFDKFDINKIGTGEGAQAYGHGLYFAGNPKVAEEYRQSLAGWKMPSGEIINPSWDDPRFFGLNELRKANYDVGKAREVVAKQSDQWPEQISAFDKLIKAGITPNAGHMYEVKLHANPEHLLDWDKPLASQPRAIQGLNRYVDEMGGEQKLRNLSRQLEERRRAENEAFSRAWDSDEPLDLSHFNSKYPSHEAVADLLANINKGQETKGEDFYRSLSPQEYDYKGATENAQRLGIPGIKYLDQGSRGAGEGSSNYVMFSHEPVEIMRRYRQGGHVGKAMRMIRKGFEDGGTPSFDESGSMMVGGYGEDVPQKTAHDFVQQQLNTGEPQLPQMDREARDAWKYGAPKMAAHMAAYEIPGVGQALAGYDAANAFKELASPEVRKQLANKNYMAALPALADAGMSAMGLGGSKALVGAGALGTGLLASDEAEAGPIGSAMKIARKFVKNPVRVTRPEIYSMSPSEMADIAESNVAPESPALKRLFGVTRGEMNEIAGARPGTAEPSIMLKENARGSEAAKNIMTPRNAQRMVDILAEANKRPNLSTGMRPWYYMDPAYNRMVDLIGPDAAEKEYHRLNTSLGVHSPGAPVPTEINRGLGAYYFGTPGNNYGNIQDYIKYGGDPATAPAVFQGAAPGLLGHPYHSTSHGLPLGKFYATGEHGMQSPKAPLYIQASGSPRAFQTTRAVPDAHYTRIVGLPDTRTAQSKASYDASMSMPEYTDIGPWWEKKIAKPAGMEAVPAQALTWGAGSHLTGVDTPIGAPKLELLADHIMQRAAHHGVSPERARDLILQGKMYKRGGKVEGALRLAHKISSKG